MTDRARWQQIDGRAWAEISNTWIETAPSIPRLLDRPDPGVDKLPSLLSLKPEQLSRQEWVPGLATNILWDSLFLYRKCDHVKLAAERMVAAGLGSWSMFNAYHSAYLGARGILMLLGIALPDLAGRQVLIELFPNPEKRSRNQTRLPPPSFVMKSIGSLDQRAVWDCLQRTFNQTSCDFWDAKLVGAIKKLKSSEITPPRNHFLYKAGYWLYDDFDADLANDFSWLTIAESSDKEDRSFLMWLCFSVHRLYSELLGDLAAQSELIEAYFSAAREASVHRLPQPSPYDRFLEGR